MISRVLAIAMLACCFSLPLAAQDTEPSDRRIRLLAYDPSEVYALQTRYGFQSYIEFSPQEEIETISVGDRSLWQIIPSKHRLFIRPMDVGVTTNMTVITSRRSYQFDLKAGDADKSDVVYVVRFVYPEDRPREPSSSAIPAGGQHLPTAALTATSQTHLGTPNRNYQYTFTGADNLAPLQTFDDGKQTYLKLRPEHPTPRVLLMDLQGKKTPVIPEAYDGYLVIPQVSPQIALHYPEGEVYLYNEWLLQQ